MSNLDYYENRRDELHPYISSFSKKILDVGCGAGNLSYAIKQRNDAEVWGIELFPEAAEIASQKIDKVLTGKVEEKINELPDNYFDTIIFADILEHLYDPYKLLADIRRKLTIKGEIVASIPNTGHWLVIKSLLNGVWNYAEAGLLDFTHIRFFTRKTILEMFLNANYVNLNITGIITNHEKIPGNILKACSEIGIDSSELKKESQVFQYIVNTVNQEVLFNSVEAMQLAKNYIDEKKILTAYNLLMQVLQQNKDLTQLEKEEINQVVKTLEPLI